MELTQGYIVYNSVYWAEHKSIHKEYSMAGRFLRAPLLYVTARIRTTQLPQLSPEQVASLEQAMVKAGLPELKAGTIKEMNLKNLAGLNDIALQVDASKLYTVRKRRGFLRQDRTESLIVEPDGFEFRVSGYTKYGDFIARFSELLAVVKDAVTAFSGVMTQEFMLSYADVIVPYSGRKLADYFQEDGKILPLNVLAPSGNNERRLGQVQITRVVGEEERILIFLEQLPLMDGSVPRFLPQAMVEPEGEFVMRLAPNVPSKSASGDYGLLMTQAARIAKMRMDELDIETTFGSLHSLTKDTFWGLINQSVCKKDWAFNQKE